MKLQKLYVRMSSQILCSQKVGASEDPKHQGKDRLLLSTLLGLDTGVGGGIVLLSRPVELGLRHSVSLVGGTNPGLVKVSSTLCVPFSEIDEFSGLSYVLLIVGGFLGCLFCANLFVLLLGEAEGNVGPVGKLSNLKVLLSSCTVVVLVSNRGEKVHVRDFFEQGLIQLGGLGGLGSRHEGRSGGHGGSDDNSGDLHCC